MRTMIKKMRSIISLLAALCFPFLLQAAFLPKQSIVEIEITKEEKKDERGEVGGTGGAGDHDDHLLPKNPFEDKTE